MYRASAYCVADLITRIPSIIVIDIIFCAISFWLVGVSNTFDSFLFFTVVMIQANFCAEAFLLALGAFTGNVIIAIALGVTIYGYFMLMSGAFVLPEDMSQFMAPASFISYYKYTLEAFVWNSFPGLSFKCPPEVPVACRTSGDDVLKKSFHAGGGYFISNKWEGFEALWVFFLAFSILYYVGLRHAGRRKK